MAASTKSAKRGALSFPNVKLLSYHLQMASKTSIKDGKQFWACQYNGRSTEFTYAWVQGMIVELDMEKEEVLIKDDSGKIILAEVRVNPATIEDMYMLEQGQYVMAVGELKDNSNVPVLFTQKLKVMHEGKQELSALWPLEVQHQLKYTNVSQ